MIRSLYKEDEVGSGPVFFRHSKALECLVVVANQNKAAPELSRKLAIFFCDNSTLLIGLL